MVDLRAIVWDLGAEMPVVDLLCFTLRASGARILTRTVVYLALPLSGSKTPVWMASDVNCSTGIIFSAIVILFTSRVKQ